MAFTIAREFRIPAKLPGPLLTYKVEILFILSCLDFKKSSIKITNFS